MVFHFIWVFHSIFELNYWTVCIRSETYTNGTKLLKIKFALRFYIKSTLSSETCWVFDKHCLSKEYFGKYTIHTNHIYCDTPIKLCYTIQECVVCLWVYNLRNDGFFSFLVKFKRNLSDVQELADTRKHSIYLPLSYPRIIISFYQFYCVNSIFN